MKTNLLLISIVALFALSCNNNYTKEISGPDGSKRISYFSEPNDSLNYVTEHYDPEGALLWREEYQNGLLAKEVLNMPVGKDYYRERDQYNLGIEMPGKEYEFLAYFTSGTIQTHIRTFEDQSLTGWHRNYHINGLLERNIPIHPGPHGSVYQGQFQEYFDNGMLKLIGYYNHDEPDSIWSYYNESGVFVKSILVKDGKQKTLELGE